MAAPENEITSPARKLLPSCGVRIVGFGGFPTAMFRSDESVEFASSETRSRAT